MLYCLILNEIILRKSRVLHLHRNIFIEVPCVFIMNKIENPGIHYLTFEMYEGSKKSYMLKQQLCFLYNWKQPE